MLFMLALLVLLWGVVIFVCRKELAIFYGLFREAVRENRQNGKHPFHGFVKDDDVTPVH